MDDFMVAWTPASEHGPARLEVGPHPDRSQWSANYLLTAGSCSATFLRMTEAEQGQALLNLAAQVMFDGVAPGDVLREFAKVRVWRDMGVLLPSGWWRRAFDPGRNDWTPHNPDGDEE